MFKTWITLIVAVILYSSCQKEIEQNIHPGPSPVPASDSNYIDTLYKTITRGGITDTVVYFKYYFDASKRVTLVKWEVNDFMQPVNGGGTEIYYYNNIDSLPYKSLRTLSYYSNGMVYDTCAFFYSFDNSGRLVKDSFLNWHRTVGPPSAYYFIRIHTAIFQYSPGLIVKNNTSVPILDPPNNYTYISTDSITISAGNPVSLVRYQGTLKAFLTTLTYDNNPNPNTKLNIFKAYQPIPNFLQLDFYDSFIGKNNIITYHTFSFLTPIYYNTTYTYTNTYLPNGNLLKAATPSPTTVGDIEAWIYNYGAF